MSTDTAVEVFLGNPTTIPSENYFLARLQRDLLTRGVSARILANLQVGKDDRQVDFVVITDHRVVQIEEKTFPGRIVEGPKNGPWKVQVGASEVREVGNPVWQARRATYAVSDALQAFADTGSAPGPRVGRFFRDIDTVVCAFPVLPEGSLFDAHQYVTVLGYDALLDRLQRRGPRVPWSDADWDAFGQALNLYRAADDSPEGMVRRAGAAAVDAYRGLYLQAQTELPTLVPTAVTVDGRRAARPELAGELAAGRGVLIHGSSELGKTLWARTAAAELARAGNVPIWLAADVCETSFRTSMARAIAPYTSLSPDELLRAAEAAGRVVVFIIDDLMKASESVRQALLDGAQAVRMRNSGRGLLITAQAADAANSIPDCLDVALTIPDDAERQALLGAYGAPEIIDRCTGFVTPLELSLAAACVGELAAGASAAELLDRHVDRLVDGDDHVRDGLRIIARRMHAHIMPSLSRPDVARTLRRDHGFTDAALNAVFACPILTLAHGRVSFRHERFEHFLAAEALLLDAPDPHTLARTLNTPRCADLRADAIALESDEDRLGVILSACKDADALVASATGRLGRVAARVTETLLVDTLNVACALTSAPGITYQSGAAPIFDGRWSMPSGRVSASNAHLTAIGRLLRHGRFIDGAARLLDHTDALCARTLADGEARAPGLADQLFANTYVLLGRDALPGSVLAHAATEPLLSGGADGARAAEAAVDLLCRQRDPGLGVLYVAGHLLRFTGPTPLMADVIVKCLESDRYHLRLLGLQLAEESARCGFDAASRRTVIDAIDSVPTNNLAISSSVVEALSAFGELTPVRTRDDIAGEIAAVLSMPDDPLARKMAYGIVAGQFENDVIGPYYEAVCDLCEADRERLLAMALDGYDADGIAIGWILHELDDLSDPVTRAAVVRYVARTDPSSWFSAQSGMEGIVRALALLSAEGVPLPEPVDGGSSDPAWRASMTVIMGAVADAEGRPVDPQAVNAAWAMLVGKHRDVLASLLMNLRHMHGLHSKAPEEVHERVLAAMPRSGVDVLVWGLEHLHHVRSLCRYDHRRDSYVIDLLGRLGDRRAADVLRRFADDPDVGEAAAAAIRSIEARAVTQGDRPVR
jgi:hypothetical protein